MTTTRFQCSSASRKFLNEGGWRVEVAYWNKFQCSSASRKFLNFIRGFSTICCQPVSVLFSEPKIPQFRRCPRAVSTIACFSALQRAENSSIEEAAQSEQRYALGFSALQRAENSSIVKGKDNYRIITFEFQCSSASRKFLNANGDLQRLHRRVERFSALQRAENSSILSRSAVRRRCPTKVSVLFSEPKIPQFEIERREGGWRIGFSALQRAENSSMRSANTRYNSRLGVSVLFSEPKIPQFGRVYTWCDPTNPFQCSSASRKFLNVCLSQQSTHTHPTFQCSSASRKFLNRTQGTHDP